MATPNNTTRKSKAKSIARSVYDELGQTETTVEGVNFYSSPHNMSIAMIDTYVECGLAGQEAPEKLAAAAVFGSLLTFRHPENVYKIANITGCSSEGLREMARDMIGLVSDE